MAFSQADLDAIAAAQSAHPTLPPGYLGGVAQIETGGSRNPDSATSGTGPVGLFQIAPSTYQNPGFGLPNNNVTRDQAVAALQDPATSANFAADYLTALSNSKGGINAATQAYSGGGYDQTAVLAAESQFPGGGGVGTPSTAPVGTTSPGGTNPVAQGTTAGAGGSSSGSSWTTPIWELLQRMGIFGLGAALLLIALIALLFSSKSMEINLNEGQSGGGGGGGDRGENGHESSGRGRNGHESGEGSGHAPRRIGTGAAGAGAAEAEILPIPA